MLNQMVYLFFKVLNIQINLKNSGKLQC